MNDTTGGGRGAPVRRPRAGGLILAVTATTVLAAACGSSPSPAAAGGSKTYRQALAYAGCMRSHGEPGWPDPSSTGTFSTGQVDIDAPAFAAASNACQRLLPGGAQFQLSAAQRQQILAAGLKAASCMRDHGIRNFPDPSVQDTGSDTNIGFRVSLAGTGITRSEVQSPFFQSASKACGLGGGGS